ncbi:hypothetical protein AVEN_84351-1 [Araneus ventricosus]|uniref:Uncharacterized protein n=1 Tax=Araneus ventricosus TaxID=182803 RepID=A0A4Y2TV74_ARAVE|nr:hypothetical protein AVEN_84351-1 [Araneus ventricosus]
MRRDGLVVRCRRRSRRVPGAKSHSTEENRVLGLLHVKSYARGHPACVVRKFGKGVRQLRCRPRHLRKWRRWKPQNSQNHNCFKTGL